MSTHAPRELANARPPKAWRKALVQARKRGARQAEETRTVAKPERLTRRIRRGWDA